MAPKRKSGGILGASNSKLKQGNLFSFFAKKTSTTANTAATTNNAAAAAPAPARAVQATTKQPPANPSTSAASSHFPVARDSTETATSAVVPPPKAAPPSSLKTWTVGTRLEVYWPDDDEYYAATITNVRDNTSVYLKYDDGQREWTDLATETYRLLASSSKRRKIQDDDEEEEFEMALESSEDDDLVGDDDKDEDDNDQWMVSDGDDDDDDDDDDDETQVKRRGKTIIVTQHKRPPSNSKTPARSSTKFSAPSSQKTPKHVTPATVSETTSITLLSQSTSPSFLSSQPTPSTTPSASSKSSSPPPYVKNALNVAGSHVHNHLDFLHPPRDQHGRTPDHPLYDPRTLQIRQSDWVKHCGTMTDAVKQWWDMKAQYFDTVLLFKTGKFFEMFHMDADIGVQVLGLNYMKGHVAHAGFPEICYGSMADKLVKAGCKVARVEQTETPAQLAERKKTYRGGNKPKVVNREVCSVLTIGTRTFCFLDDENGILNETSHGGSAGPLLAIREIKLDMMDVQDADGDAVQPECEYGITLVDAIRGSVTIGQFADDVLRSRMNTLLTAFAPSEILLEGGESGASPSLRSLIRSIQSCGLPSLRVETVLQEESFPKSTAISLDVRRQLERPTSKVHPWDVSETLAELHRRRYYPQASKKDDGSVSVGRWPKVLRAAVEGGAELALSSLGAALFYLQRNLIDGEILSLAIVKAYIPPESCTGNEKSRGEVEQRVSDQHGEEMGLVERPKEAGGESNASDRGLDFNLIDGEVESINHMSLDGTTIQNLEILVNSADKKVAGSLWGLINYTKTPHGSRLLRAWLLRPLFRKVDIDRRADAVQELVSGAAAVALSEAVSILAKCGDIERLLSRVHSMSGAYSEGGEAAGTHPNDRAVFYESATYTKRKVGDFSKVLNGLRQASRIPEVFEGLDIQSGLLRKVVRFDDQGGCFPRLAEELNWFVDNFDCDVAAKGLFNPSKGVDEEYDKACEAVESIETELAGYRDEMCNILRPAAAAKSSWKYVNTKRESKDKYLIELPASIAVPDDFILKGKRGSGAKQVNKYRTALVEALVQQLEHALEIQKERKDKGMQLIFAKFDSMRPRWAAAATATALIDALGALARASTNAGYTRPIILDCPSSGNSSIKVVQGRHPCVEKSLSSGEFVPNNLSLGLEREDGSNPRVLLLSGVNMGGKSTCLRQTCLLAILAQIGCFVPADECSLTPVDRIFTRLGASDRILLGQSTFFVELAETAAALRGATRRSIVIMDELGRGTSTFDGTAIASAAVKHLVERSRCIALFATHYHSLLDEWKDNPIVMLGHMECVVEDTPTSQSANNEGDDDGRVTFLYTLGEGGCPKSFGINVARLAGLPREVLSNAKRVSSDFEQQLNKSKSSATLTARNATQHKRSIMNAIGKGDWEELVDLWTRLQH